MKNRICEICYFVMPVVILSSCSPQKTENKKSEPQAQPAPSSTISALPEEFPFLDSKISEDSKVHGEFVLATEFQSYNTGSAFSRHVCAVFRDGIRTYVVRAQKTKIVNGNIEIESPFKPELDNFAPMPIIGSSNYWRIKNILESKTITEKHDHEVMKSDKVTFSGQIVIARKKNLDGSFTRVKIFYLLSAILDGDNKVKTMISRLDDSLSLDVAKQLRADCLNAAKASIKPF